MINYSIISEAMDFYSRNGFQPIETPWIVPSDISAVTKPKIFNTKFACNSGVLVGSAEQGFLDLIMKGELKPGNKIMSLCELSDVYLTVQQLAEDEGLSMSDLQKMAEATERAFLLGRR